MSSQSRGCLHCPMSVIAKACQQHLGECIDEGELRLGRRESASALMWGEIIS